jgi:hypothetical protein
MIIISYFISIFLIYYLINRSIKRKEIYNNYGVIVKGFEDLADYLMNYFIVNYGIKDVLISNTKLNTKDYNKLRSDCAEYVWESTPEYLKRNLLLYMTDQQISNLILIKVDTHVSNVYQYSDDYPQIITQEELLKYGDEDDIELNREVLS